MSQWSPKAQLQSRGLRPKKHFGQNFLADEQLAQSRHQVAITLDGDQPSSARQERPRQRAEASSEFDDAGALWHQIGDFLRQLLVSEEVLAEVLFGTEPAALQLGLRAPLTQWAGFSS